MKILLTGADGFIGSHLAERLVSDGHTVRALVMYDALGRAGLLPAGLDLEVFPCDIRDRGRCQAAVQGREVVLHLAALVGIPWSYCSPAAYVQTNVQGTLNLLEAAVQCGVGRFIHTSSSEVYGTARSVLMTEDHALRAQSPYAATKIAADQLALSYHYSFGLPVSIIRPFNTYGPRQSLRAVIPTIIAQLLYGRDEIKLGSLKPTRDFTYIDDLVAAYVAMLASDDCFGEVVNIGSGFAISVRNLAETINVMINGPDIPIIINRDPSRRRPWAGEVKRLCADASKAKRMLSWLPAHDLEQGLVKTIEWFREDPARYVQRGYVV